MSNVVKIVRAPEERTEIQSELLRGDLLDAVVDTAEALRSSHAYDRNRWTAEGALAVLCHALQTSARADGKVTMAGMSFALETLRARAKAGR